MKIITGRIVMLFALLTIFSLGAAAQIEVRIRPSAPSSEAGR